MQLVAWKRQGLAAAPDIEELVSSEKTESVYETVGLLLEGIELDAERAPHAAIALNLARKLDEAAHSDSGAIAMAVAGISKELRAVLDTILEDSAQDDEFVADLYSEVGDS